MRKKIEKMVTERHPRRKSGPANLHIAEGGGEKKKDMIGNYLPEKEGSPLTKVRSEGAYVRGSDLWQGGERESRWR